MLGLKGNNLLMVVTFALMAVVQLIAISMLVSPFVWLKIVGAIVMVFQILGLVIFMALAIFSTRTDEDDTTNAPSV